MEPRAEARTRLDEATATSTASACEGDSRGRRRRGRRHATARAVCNTSTVLGDTQNLASGTAQPAGTTLSEVQSGHADEHHNPSMSSIRTDALIVEEADDGGRSTRTEASADVWTDTSEDDAGWQVLDASPANDLSLSPHAGFPGVRSREAERGVAVVCPARPSPAPRCPVDLSGCPILSCSSTDDDARSEVRGTEIETAAIPSIPENEVHGGSVVVSVSAPSLGSVRDFNAPGSLVDISGCSLCDRSEESGALEGSAADMERTGAEVDQMGHGAHIHPSAAELSTHGLGCVRYLHHFFRRARAVRPDCWRSRGGLSGLSVWRRVSRPNCDHGQSLASSLEFEAQAGRARGLLQWYQQHVLLLKRLRSGQTPLVLDLCCKAGGASEGFRRGGASVCGVDIEPQLHFVARFGAESFVLADAFDMAKLRELVRRLKPILIWASPPCQGYSSAPALGAPSQIERLIPLLRDMLDLLGVPYVIENVMGSADDMGADALQVWGELFGLHQRRSRLLSGGGGLVLQREASLWEPGTKLRGMTCLGKRRRFPRRDLFGRTVSAQGPRVCCDGNIFATQGQVCPAGTSTWEHAESMGLDRGHMDYSELSQAVPPAYASFVLGQAAIHVLKSVFGLPVISYSEMLASPERAAEAMRMLRRGAGGTSPSLGLTFVGPDGARPRFDSTAHGASEASGQAPAQQPSNEGLERTADPEDVAVWKTSRDEPTAAAREGSSIAGGARWSLDESQFRELDYTHAGCYDQVVIHGDAPNWSARLLPCRRRPRHELRRSGSSWEGHNTLIHLPGEGEGEAVADLCRRAASGSIGRVTVIVDYRWATRLESAGFRCVMRWESHQGGVIDGERHEANLRRAAVALCYGRRECPLGLFLDHNAVRPFMDPRDRGFPSCGPEAKSALAWSPLERHADRWAGHGLPPDVVSMMTDGVVVDTVGADELYAQEVGQYAFKDAEHFVRGSQECDRALIAGHLEKVPDAEAEWALANGSVHPWTVVHQSESKWRSCQDYKSGTNRRVISTPFNLCTAHEVGRVVTRRSHFAKFDLRDGFWSVPVAARSRHHLMVRHPATGQLLRCTSLPFGYARSPEHFCRVTEAVAQLFRRRVAGMGIHIFVFVDDYLVVADNRELTATGMQMFRSLLDELGLPFAPHKTRGPSQVMEFLGFLLSNVEQYRCISLTASRQAKLEQLIDDWLKKEPPPGRPPGQAEPRVLASLLGQLVFSSEVIPNARVYMQAMLRQFKGLEVDWARGMVRYVHSQWQQVELLEGFWRDLHWWRSALRSQNCKPFDTPTTGELAIVGTDASDLACGELVWLDGAREETMLMFTAAERRRPINFRELRGALRALEVWGARLRGRLVLIETDNSFGHYTTSNLRCKTEDSQELVRRILHLSLVHGFTVRSCHTPGLMLVRPDQTSRGAAPEEPRFRLPLREFHGLERRFGPFDELLGAEREIQSVKPAAARSFPRLWAHPSFDTVGSTLRAICDRLTADSSTCPRGVVIVPFAPEAGWWKLTRHFACVGRWDSGALALEANVLGAWVPARSQRPTLVLSFPRAGSLLLPLTIAISMGETPAQREMNEAAADLGASALRRMAEAWVNRDSPLPAGTLLYQPRRVSPAGLRDHEARSLPGVLYLTLEPFDGRDEFPVCAELRRLASGHRHAFVHDSGSYAPGQQPWGPDVWVLWVANHLGGQMVVQPGQAGRSKSVRYLFDFERAEDEIAHLRGSLAQAGVGELVELEATSDPEEPAPSSPAPTPVVTVAPKHACMLIGGFSRLQGRPAVLLVQSRQGLWMAPGGNCDEGESGPLTACRELVEEFFGVAESASHESAEALLRDFTRDSCLYGPFGNTSTTRHASYACLSESCFGDIDELVLKFVPNGECQQAMLVPLTGLDGRSLQVGTFEFSEGERLIVHLRDYLGYARVKAMRELLRSSELGEQPRITWGDPGVVGGELRAGVPDGDLLPMSRLEARVTRSSAVARSVPVDGVEVSASPPRLPPPPPPSSSRAPVPVAGVTMPAQCRYAAMRCDGCRQEIGLEVWIIPCGGRMVCNRLSCYQEAARLRIRAEADAYEGERARARAAQGPLAIGDGRASDLLPTGPVDPAALRVSSVSHIDMRLPGVKPKKAETNQRGTQLIEGLSEARRVMVRACLEGKCAFAGSGESTMTCVGSCQRQLHGVKCAQITAGHALIGCFECADCQLASIGATRPFTEAAIRGAEETMLLILSRGAESSGAGFADWVKKEAEWALSVGGGNVRLPSDHPTSLNLFFTWLVRDAERARSLTTLWRSAGAYMVRTHRVNLTSTEGGCKAHYSSLLDAHGVVEHPRTAATPRMAGVMMGTDFVLTTALAISGSDRGVISQECQSPFICCRVRLDTCLEGAMGLRVGEALGAGDFHGLTACNLCVLTKIDSGLVTVEAMLEHSKTKFRRWSTSLGTTLGMAAMPVAQAVRDYWRVAKLKTVSWTEGGFLVETVDYRVVRLSMLGMSQTEYDRLFTVLAVSSLASVRTSVKALAERARRRYEGTNSKDKRYINIFGGSSDDPNMRTMQHELVVAGFGEFVSVIDGPLLRSTDGARISHMAIDPTSTYTSLHKIFDAAYVLANPTGDPDPWLDLQGLDEPLWGHHSLRRMADTVARATMARTGVTERDIDLVFGWQEKFYSKVMQLHYETRFDRDKRYRVTMYL